MTELPEFFFGLQPGDRVMVAWSGGVDSAYAAELCRAYGLVAETVTMHRFPADAENDSFAKASAEQAGFPHHLLDLEKEFREEIMHETWKRYSAGETPNPCTLCNPAFKFGRLRSFALEHLCKALVTGHYVRIQPGPSGEIELRKGVCTEKDQSYFLFAVPPEALAFCRTPLGVQNKSEVRSEADKRNLPAVKRHESQDICFGGESMPDLLAGLFPEDPPLPGRFLDESGKELGRHKGIQFYTIGQRKGTGIALGKPAFVKTICGADRSIVLTTDGDHLLSSGITVEKPRFLTDLPETFRCDVRVRYRSRAVSCTVLRHGEVCEVRFDSPVRAAAPGQAAVFYDGDRVLGGGWIRSVC